MNQFIISGRLGKDWERIDKGIMFITNSVAVDHFSKGEKKTDWFNVKVFNEKALDSIEKYSHKGDNVLIQGRLSLFQGQNDKYPQITLIADRVEWFTAGNKETPENTLKTPDNASYHNDEEFDINKPIKKDEKGVEDKGDGILWE